MFESPRRSGSENENCKEDLWKSKKVFRKTNLTSARSISDAVSSRTVLGKVRSRARDLAGYVRSSLETKDHGPHVSSCPSSCHSPQLEIYPAITVLDCGLLPIGWAVLPLNLEAAWTVERDVDAA
jgi:hypothetical protein